MDGDGTAEVNLGDSFLSGSTQYVVEGGGDGDDSQLEEERDDQPLREQVRYMIQLTSVVIYFGNF